MTIKPFTVHRVAVAIAVGASVVAWSAPAAAERRPITDVAGVRAQLDLMTSADRIPGALAQVRDRRGSTGGAGVDHMRRAMDVALCSQPATHEPPGAARTAGLTSTMVEVARSGP